MKRAVITLTLLTVPFTRLLPLGALMAPLVTPFVIWTPARAHAEDTLGQRVDHTKERAVGAVEGAKESAREAAERAAEVAEQAQERSREAADSLSERARDVADSAKEYASELVVGAREQAATLGERAAEVAAQGKAAAGEAMQGLRDEARAILISAAVALDNKSRDARRDARNASWQKLKDRFHLGGDRPSMALSEELRDHEYRIARLRRAEELARAVGDESALTRSGKLLEAEYARHKRRVEQLRDKDRKQAKR